MVGKLSRRLTEVFAGLRGAGRLSEEAVNEALREIRIALLEADVNFGVAKQLVKSIRDKAVGQEIFGSLNAEQTLVRIVRDELTDILGGGQERPIAWSPQPPITILMCGLQGSGKTTTCAKLGRWLIKLGKKPMLAACDVQRPAAIKQLQVLGEQVGVPVFTADGSPEAIAKGALERAKHLFLDCLIVDTAGRLSVDEPLMEELANIHKATKPSESLLVLDATTGQEAVSVAQAFHERLSLTGAVFTKMDGDTRGGAMLSVKAVADVPVRFIGAGEATDALETFVPSRMAERILGMGDVIGIIEKAEEAMVGEDAKSMEAKVRGGTMNFDDMLTQMRMIRKMGPLNKVMGMLPGLGNALPEGALDQINDGHIGRIEAIVLSMTPQERRRPDILNGSRRKRIARGSGAKVEEVNRLVEQLYAMRKSMKQFGKMEKRMRKKGRRR